MAEETVGGGSNGNRERVEKRLKEYSHSRASVKKLKVGSLQQITATLFSEVKIFILFNGVEQ